MALFKHRLRRAEDLRELTDAIIEMQESLESWYERERQAKEAADAALAVLTAYYKQLIEEGARDGE